MLFPLYAPCGVVLRLLSSALISFTFAARLFGASRRLLFRFPVSCCSDIYPFAWDCRFSYGFWWAFLLRVSVSPFRLDLCSPSLVLFFFGVSFRVGFVLRFRRSFGLHILVACVFFRAVACRYCRRYFAPVSFYLSLFSFFFCRLPLHSRLGHYWCPVFVWPIVAFFEPVSTLGKLWLSVFIWRLGFL